MQFLKISVIRSLCSRTGDIPRKVLNLLGQTGSSLRIKSVVIIPKRRERSFNSLGNSVDIDQSFFLLAHAPKVFFIGLFDFA